VRGAADAAGDGAGWNEARDAINGLMAEVLEDHIRLHLLYDGHAPLRPELGEDLIDLGAPFSSRG
jgi:hypothetical protein